MKLAGLLAAFVLVGSLDLTSDPGNWTLAVGEVETRLGALAPGSSGGLNATQGTASVTGTLLTTTTNLLYVNNTNASGVWYARLNVVSTTGIANLPTLTIGINNGTATATQVVASLGSLTQSTGAYIRLEPASSNIIYVTEAVTTLGISSTFTLSVYAADDTAESAFVVTNAVISIV